MIWNMDPVAFAVGGWEIAWYGIFFALGLAAGFFITDRFFSIEGKAHCFPHFIPFGFLGPIIGGRLAHFVFYEPARMFEEPSILYRPWDAPGLSSHGAGIGLFAAFIVFSRWRPEVTFLWLSDIGAIVILVIGAFIRLGNFFRSEIIGTPSEVPWAVVFSSVDELPRHPVQIYEGGAYAVLAVLLLIAYRVLRQRVAAGWFLGVSLLLTFSVRFVLELVKENQSPLTEDMILNMGQILSLPFIVAGLYLVVSKGTGSGRR